ncbi:MAG: hypothetical protein WAL97_03300 [Halobacteriota archaeon]|jgi:hypothetical protein
MSNEKKEEKRIAMEEREERRKHPFEATVTPEVLERGRHWITVRLRNVSTERLVDVSATLYTYNSHDLDVLPSGSFHFAQELRPHDMAALNFHVFANHTGWVYLHVTAYRDGAFVNWYSPYYEVRLIEDPAEINTFFVNRPYWAPEETIETETVVHALRDVSDLRLEIAAIPPSKSHTLMDVVDIDFIAEGGTKRFVSELYASEEGMYHLTARLFHEQKLISSKLASCYVTPLEE